MIPYLDLKAQYADLKDDIDAAIRSVLEDSQFVLGAHVAEFERSFAAYCGVRHAVAVNSGTSALHLALLAAGIGPGDEVITVPFTFIATIAAIRYCNAIPVLVDIDPVTFNIDVNLIERAITPKTRAIMPVDLYGQPAEMSAILDIARKYNLPVIEDAAQAHGAEYRGARTGALGDIGCFSFYPTKNLGAYGEGGMVTTNQDAIAKQVRLLRDWGQDRKYHHVINAFNYRMEGLQGAILNVKLRHLERWTEARRRIAARYDALLKDVPVVKPRPCDHVRHVYHAYTIRTPHRDALQQALQKAGIQTAVHYGIPAHLQPAHQDLGYGPGSFPHAEQASNEVLSLPIYPEMPDSSLNHVAEAIRDFFAQGIGAQPTQSSVRYRRE